MTRRIEISEIRREELTNAAMKCIVSKGYDRVTLEDVTREAGLSKGIASYYFKNREALLLSVIQRMWENLASIASRICGVSQGVLDSGQQNEMLREHFANPDVDLIAFAEEGMGLFLHWMDEHPHYVRVILEFWCQMPRNPEIAELNRSMQKYFRNMSEVIIQEGIHRGLFRKQNPQLAAYTLLSAITGIAINHGIYRREFDLKKLEKAVKELVIDYLKAE